MQSDKDVESGRYFTTMFWKKLNNAPSYRTLIKCNPVKSVKPTARKRKFNTIHHDMSTKSAFANLPRCLL